MSINFPEKLRAAWFAAIVCSVTGIAPAASPGDTGIRSTLDRWVETRALIAEERGQWREQEEQLRRSVELLENELDRLGAEIERLQAETTAADRERSRLTAESETQLALSEAIDARITGLETALAPAISSFPDPLRERTRALSARLDGDEADERPSARRLQTVLGLLGEADRFQEGVTTGREILSFEDGAEAEVRVLYLGLAQAYYLGPRGERAGIGRPAEDGWHWTPRADLAAGIGRAFRIHDNEAAPDFVRLPVTIREN